MWIECPLAVVFTVFYSSTFLVLVIVVVVVVEVVVVVVVVIVVVCVILAAFYIGLFVNIAMGRCSTHNFIMSFINKKPIFTREVLF